MFKRLGTELALLAVLLVEAAGQTDPEAPAIHLPAGLDSMKQSALQAAIHEHNYAAAETLLAEEAGRNPKLQSLLVLLADVLFLDGKQLNAALVLKNAELLGPLDEQSRFLLALSYISLGRKNLAVTELEQLTKSSPANALYPYWLSRLAYRRMDLDSALSRARQAVRLNPAFAKAYDQLGLCYAGLARHQDAIEAFQQAIRLVQQQSLRWPWPSMNLGTLYLRLERLDEAEAALRQSLALEPDFPVAHLRLGRVLEKRQQPAEAIRELKEAARLDPTYPEPHYALARIYKKQDDPKAAQDELRIFQQLRNVDKQKGITRPD